MMGRVSVPAMRLIVARALLAIALGILWGSRTSTRVAARINAVAQRLVDRVAQRDRGR